ncbi:MAG TPA: hypothetical protein VMT03_14220 [Polyangia bacterium]|nr:hypothetical protein [Polyangia bacterium]
MDLADSLYEALPSDFVRARNALVKSLKIAGNRAEADRISRMARPTASVWASNQVARRAADLVGRLAKATALLQSGIQRDRDRYATAINEHRELLNQLRERVEQALADGGLRAAPPVVTAAVQNFRAGLTDEAVRPLIEQGRLERDVGLDAGGGLFGMSAVDPGPAPAPAPVAAPSTARAAVPDPQKERDERERERARAKARADVERRVHALRRSSEAAAAGRARHESAVDEARRRLESAEQALAAAQAAESQSAAALAAAESELRRLPDEPA